MRRVSLLFLLVAACATPKAPSFDPAITAEIDARIAQAIAEHKIPGGIYYLEQRGKVYEKVYGNRALVPAVEPMTADTIFDAASITKVVATTPSIWLLIQRGKIGIDDPVQKFIPEFPYADVTIRHLLTHTSGLRPDLDLKDPWSGYDTAMQLIMKEQLVNKPGFVFRYSDINFELLGEIVRRVSGEPLDVFAKKEIFEPLGMTDTDFRPIMPGAVGEIDIDGHPTARIAPTEPVDGVMLRGVVHDPTARRMGGVAGHAGLFITAHDLAKYCRMLLRGGSPIFKPEIVEQMTRVQSPANVAIKRAGGFDIDSSFSKPRGDMFPIGSYGHTGFTGGFFWIDPSSKTFFIFLSNRVHPNGKGNVVPLQRELGALSARAVGYTTPVLSRVRWPVGSLADASNGIDVLVSQHYAPLRGMRLGLITNHTGIDRAGNPTIDLLRSAPDVTLVSLFSPEHGIRGTADENVGDTTDPVSGLPIYSLYGETRKPKPEELQNIDALVYDIQDIGCRFYTYPATMLNAMQAAADAKKKFIVLDRIDPIGGDGVEGPLLKGDVDFVGWHPVVVRYGMTIGELARMFRDELHIDVDLDVVQVRGWTPRALWQDEAGQPWINTSPNMRSLTGAGLYPGIGLMESAISVGRGTATPFEVLGAPYIDGNALIAALPPMPGVTLTPIHFTPDASVFAGKECGGVRVAITDRKALRPVALGVAIATTLHRLYPNEFSVDKMQRLVRDPATMDAIRNGTPIDWSPDEAAFKARREKYLLYH